jgi:hypothetical protein
MRTLRRPLIATLLSVSIGACSTVPTLTPPVVVQCPKPQVDKALLVPAERQAATQLQNYLQTLQPSAGATPTASMH